MEDIKKVFHEPSYRGAWMERNKLSLIMYLCLFASIMFVYHVLSDGDFSFLLTLGSIIRFFGLLILAAKLFTQKSSAGVSLKTVELYALAFAARLCSILFYQGYLPFDKSGDWFYQFVEVSSLICALSIIFLALNLDQSYQFVEDAFGNFQKMPASLYPISHVVILALPALLMAMVFHPGLNRNWFTDTMWTFAAYLEVVAVLPQFYLLQKQKKAVESWTSHFVFSLGLSRVFLFTFWISSFQELANKRSKFVLSGYEGYLILLVQIVHLLIMGEFCFHYIMAAKKQSPLMIPSLDV